MDLIEGLTQEDYLDQLIEECGELIQAASKLKRARGKRNKTPVTEEEAAASLLEEIADVRLCMAMVEQSEGLNCMAVDRAMRSKYVRWKERMH